MTYSIVARCADTGQLGIAVHSHWFSVGPIVAWAAAGVGAVATQSFADPAYGHLGLAMMATGKTAPDVLAALLAGDSGRASRQVAMVDTSGNVAAHTGGRCLAHSGHVTGEGFSCQGNIMASTAVWGAMAEAYRSARGDLAERLLAALDAAEAAGGDARGKQSASLLVVAPVSSGRPWADRLVDVRVDDHPDPVKELRRLRTLAQAYQFMNEGDAAMEAGEVDDARSAYAAAAHLAPDRAELVYWHAVALAGSGRLDAGRELIRSVLDGPEGERWREITRRLPGVGLLDAETAAALMA